MMSKHKIIVGTPHRADLHIEADIKVNETGNLVIHGIPGVTYEMCDSELSLYAYSSVYSDNPELNYFDSPMDCNIYLDGKKLEEGDSYFIFDKNKMELIKTVLDPESRWFGRMYWTVQDAMKDLAQPYEGRNVKDEIVKVIDFDKFEDAPHYLIKI